ncbi:MAG: SprB repeat-containing protein [Bacteroidales bacterium]
MSNFFKFLFNISAVLFCFFNVQAQYTPDEFPLAGTNFVVAKSLVFPAKKIGIRDLGSTVWDLSMFNPSTFDTIRMVDPKKTRYGRRFPESEIALVTNPVKMEYLVIDSGKIYLAGLIDDFMEKNIPVLLKFPDKVLLKNPWLKTDEEYADTSETHFASPYYHQPGTDSIKAEIFYVRTGRVDAQGELITPLGKYQVEREVVFVEKRVRGFKYSVFGWTPAPEYSVNRHYTYYRWYKKDVKLPVAEAYLNEDDYIEYVCYHYDSPMKLNFTGEDVSCKGGKNGKVDLTVIGGIPDYTYQWTNGAQTQDLDSVKAGTYRVVVTDNRGRTISSFYTVSEPIIELQANVEVRNVSCRGNRDGSALLSISGGKAPYDFVWSNDSVNETISNLSPGIIKYMVVDAGGCRIVDSIEIKQPERKLTFNFDLSQVSCFNGSDGHAELLPDGGTPPYRFIWDDGDTSTIRDNLKAGMHKVVAYDKNNCTAGETLTIKQPETPLKINKEIKAVSCFGWNDGGAEMKVSGGKPPYQYFWSDSSTNNSIKGYSAGDYKVTISDRNNCQVVENVTIPQPASALMVTNLKSDVKCFGGNDGEIKISTTGGTAPYNYSWSNGSNKPEIKNLTKGSYLVKVTDKNQCFETATIDIVEPEKPLFADFEKVDVKCKNGNNGSIKLTVEGGTPDYNYLWSDKKNLKDLENLKAGNYNVVITDKNQCRIEKEIKITEPADLIEIFAEKIDVNCNGEKSGSAYLTAKGGVPGYDFEWTNGEKSQNLVGIGAGKYTAVVTDNIGCTQSKIIEIKEPDKLTIKAIRKNPEQGQNNGEIKIEVSGGTNPWTVIWEDGHTGFERKNLATGSYPIQVKDAKGCILSEEIDLKTF